MAYDVTLTASTFILIFLLLVIVGGDDHTLRMVTRPVYLEDNLFFELVSPEQISYTYKIRPAKGFGGTLNSSIYNIGLILTEPLHACSPVTNTIFVKNNIALIERGGCSFVSKALNAQDAGAVAAVIMDNDISNDDKMVDMIGDETDRDVTLPAYFLLGRDGYMIRKTLDELELIGAVINIPINATGVPLTQLNQPPWDPW